MGRGTGAFWESMDLTFESYEEKYWSVLQELESRCIRAGYWSTLKELEQIACGRFSSDENLSTVLLSHRQLG